MFDVNSMLRTFMFGVNFISLYYDVILSYVLIRICMHWITFSLFFVRCNARSILSSLKRNGSKIEFFSIYA